MKIRLFLVLLIVGCFVQAQEFNPKEFATVNVNVNNPEKAVLKDEVILFENTNTGETVQGISNEEGVFTTHLPFGETFEIKIKGFDSDDDYTEMQIPTLKEGQASMTFTVNITIEPTKTFTLNNVHFQTNKSKITADSYPELNELVEFLALKKHTKIEVAGHTDDVGEDDANLKLSLARAKAVRNYLIKKGIAENRIVAKGYGELQPIADNTTEEGRRLNRRTQIKILED